MLAETVNIKNVPILGRSVEKCTCFCHVDPKDVEQLYNDVQELLLICSAHGNNVINGSAAARSLGNTMNKIERATRDTSQFYDSGH